MVVAAVVAVVAAAGQTAPTTTAAAMNGQDVDTAITEQKAHVDTCENIAEKLANFAKD